MSATATKRAPPWGRWARRVDALTVRERVIMFVSVAVALVAAADFLVLSPRAAEQKALGRALRAQTAELESLRRQLGDGGPGADTPIARLQRELQSAQRELQHADEEITRRVLAGAVGTRLPALLERVLRRHPQLVLQKLATGAPVTARPGAPPLEGVDLVVGGSYPALAQYVADLEQTLPGLRWLELAVVRTEAGAELQARVALLGDVR